MRAMGDERGFSMIELVVAIFISIIVIGALATMFVESNHSSLSSQRDISRLSILQQQIERIRETVKQYGFSAVALNAAPSNGASISVDPTNANDFVSGAACAQKFTIESNYNNTSEPFPISQTVADSPESLLVNGCTVAGTAISGGQLAPVQYADLSTGTTYAALAGVPAGDPYATVDTYVTQTSMAGCNTSLGSCSNDVRRVVVAVLLSSQSTNIGAAYPTYATTEFVNPVASDQTNTASGLRILGLIP